MKLKALFVMLMVTTGLAGMATAKDKCGQRCTRTFTATLQRVDSEPAMLLATAASELQVRPIVVSAHAGHHSYFQWVYRYLGEIWGHHVFEQIAAFKRIVAIATYSDEEKQSYYVAFYCVKDTQTYKLIYEIPMAHCLLPSELAHKLATKTALVEVDAPELQAAILSAFAAAPQRPVPAESD